MPNFSEPSKVLDTIRAGDEAEFSRGENRVLINRAANNEPLFDEDEAKRLGMKIFNRWGELMGALSHARRQYLSNFMSPPNFFNVSLPKAPDEVRAEWEGIITETINERMKEGECALQFFELHRSRWAAVVCHGIGPMLWEDEFSWLPRFVAIEDLRVPTDTELSFRNLTWFAVRIPYTPGELSRKAFSDAVSKFQWNRPAVAKLLSSVQECNTVMAENNYDWTSVPEKFEELRKQNAGYWTGDAMPTINLWHFYHEDEDGNWNLKVVPENNTAGTTTADEDEFVCQSQEPVAGTWRHILHVQFGDLNNKAPFMYHSVRSLGFALFEPCYWTDYTRCRLLQHTLDQFNIMLRVTDPVDRARAQIQVFQNLAVLKPGVNIIPQSERHQVDAALVESVMAQTKQLQQEASTAYTQQIDTGTKKEQTAFEVGVHVQQNNAMLSGLMLTAGIYEKFAAKEICRRFCLQGSDDKDVVEFQKECKKSGIPREWLDEKKWRVEINLPLGNGNPTMAMVESENALKLRPMLDPTAQAEALHDAAVQMVGAKRARRWVKINPPKVSEAGNAAANAFPLMMLGLPPQIPEGLNPIQQIQTLLGLAGGYVMKIEKTTKVPKPDELIGLQNVAGYIGKLVHGMHGDTGNEQLSKKFNHDLMQFTNELKKLQQKLQAEMEKQAQQKDGGKAQLLMAETKAKLQAEQALTNQKLKHNELMARQKLRTQEVKDQQARRHAEVGHLGDQRRKTVATATDIHLKKESAKASQKALDKDE